MAQATPTTLSPSAATPSRSLVMLWATLAIAALAWLDWWTGPHLSLSIFYAVPVGLAAWRGGGSLGLATSLLAMGAWTCIEVIDTPRPHVVYHFWNAVVRGGTFATIAHLAARVHGLLQEQTAIASRDGLTGLANARAFTEALELELTRSRRTERPFAVAYCDLDNFKRVNDTRGHAAGDQVLRSVAELLQVRLRATDMAARLGGDEFAILLRETDAAGAEHVVRELHLAAQERLQAVAREVGVSLGLVCFSIPPDSAAAAIQAADSLMYSVKADGKRAVRCVTWPADAAA